MSNKGSNLNVKKTIISLSSQLVDNSRSGHVFIYQTLLRDEFLKMNYDFFVHASIDFEGDYPWIIPSMPDIDHASIEELNNYVFSLYKQIKGSRQEIYILAYDANLVLFLLLVKYFQSTDIKVIANLLYRDRLLDSSSDLNNFNHLEVYKSFSSITSGLSIPENIYLTAPTNARALRALELNLPVKDVFLEGSQIKNSEVPTKLKGEGVGESDIEVYVSIPFYHVTKNLVTFLTDVLYLVNKLVTKKINLKIEGSSPLILDFQSAINSKLDLIEVNILEAQTFKSYSKLYTDCDFVWMPQGGSYKFQSSGRAKDALMSTKPVLTTFGSIGHQEMCKYGLDIGYSEDSIYECTNAFLRTIFNYHKYNVILKKSSEGLLNNYSFEASCSFLIRIFSEPFKQVGANSKHVELANNSIIDRLVSLIEIPRSAL